MKLSRRGSWHPRANIISDSIIYALSLEALLFRYHRVVISLCLIFIRRLISILKKMMEK